MICCIKGKVGTGNPCTNEATTRNFMGHFTCAECAADCERIAIRLHDLAVKYDYKPKTPDPRLPSTNASRN